MEETKLHINYFYRMFQEETRQLILEKELKTIGVDNDCDLEEFLIETCMNDNLAIEIRIEIYNKVLYKLCAEYVVLAGLDIDVYPQSVFEFVDIILEDLKENKYKESFVYSLQFIYADYLDYLGKGRPILKSSETDDLEKYMEIVLNHNYKILDFDSLNLSGVEQSKLINKLVMMELKKEIGPLPKVITRVRKDL